MFKTVMDEIWAFDAEWVPDPTTGRRVLGLDPSVDDDDVMRRMWEYGGATEAVPQPYLKTILCRVVSISAVVRTRGRDGRVAHRLYSLPDGEGNAEPEILRRFLGGIGRKKPQLVGFNSRDADLKILTQRALVHGLALPDFCKRPSRPWDGPDYFASCEHCLDLRDVFAGWGKLSLTLHELATSCGIPGKIGTDGQDVVELWRSGKLRKIVQYNECDALTTFLVWLRAAHLGGHIDTTDYLNEQSSLEEMLVETSSGPDQEHLAEFVRIWRRLRSI